MNISTIESLFYGGFAVFRSILEFSCSPKHSSLVLVSLMT